MTILFLLEFFFYLDVESLQVHFCRVMQPENHSTLFNQFACTISPLSTCILLHHILLLLHFETFLLPSFPSFLPLPQSNSALNNYNSYIMSLH